MNTTAVTAPPQPYPHRWRALALLASAQFLVTLDSSIVNIALPSMRADLYLSEAGLAWVVNAYLLAFGGLLLLFGRVADIVGRHRLFIGGAALFTGASLLAGLASGPEVLLSARALQGVGAAALSPAALSIVLTTFPDHERAKALGIWGAVAAGGGSAGVLLGGVVTDGLGWQWVFFVTVPVSAAAALLGPVLLPRQRGTGAGPRFDLAGAVTVTGAITASVYAVLNTERVGWDAPSTLVTFSVSAILLVAFLVIEHRRPAPLIPLRLFASRNFSGGSLLALLTGATLMPLWFFITLRLQDLAGYSPLDTGLAYLPMTITIFTVSVLGIARVTARLGLRSTLVIGLSLLGLALATMSWLPADASYRTELLPTLLVAAVGIGFSFMPATMAAVSGVRPADAGLASGVVNTAFQVGGALGVAVLASAAASATTTALAEGQPASAATATGHSAGLAIAAAIAWSGALIAAAVIRRPRTDRSGPVSDDRAVDQPAAA